LIYGEAERLPELGRAVSARTQEGISHVAKTIRDYVLIEAIPRRDPDAAAEMLVTLILGFHADIMRRTRPATVAETRSWTRKMLRLFLAARPHW
jgi:hypothetical protein